MQLSLVKGHDETQYILYRRHSDPRSLLAGEHGSLLSLIIRYLSLFNVTYCRSLPDSCYCTVMAPGDEANPTRPRDPPPTPPENFTLEVSSCHTP